MQRQTDLTEEEAAKFEKAAPRCGRGESPAFEGVNLGGQVFRNGGYNVLFIDRGSELARVDGVKRTSLIVDPPDGKIWRAEARKEAEGPGGEAVADHDWRHYDSVKNRPLPSAAWSVSDPPPGRP